VQPEDENGASMSRRNIEVAVGVMIIMVMDVALKFEKGSRFTRNAHERGTEIA
jgi:hypothetical protein